MRNPIKQYEYRFQTIPSALLIFISICLNLHIQNLASIFKRRLETHFKFIKQYRKMFNLEKINEKDVMKPNPFSTAIRAFHRNCLLETRNHFHTTEASLERGSAP
ncbi:hypothetical protein CEXT_382801 [Caerostris extrusa]|uniref:Uncharacterized protein n=1 Tax=Caerostris extrusa TaxID=172846 RepID=A0AAV4M8T9_CAEEX|nr:hypothetical protein CEXT_382801 [Caerostris extrusa]